jgi:hypothetical protein
MSDFWGQAESRDDTLMGLGHVKTGVTDLSAPSDVDVIQLVWLLGGGRDGGAYGTSKLRITSNIQNNLG